LREQARTCSRFAVQSANQAFQNPRCVGHPPWDRFADARARGRS